jgi:predicted TIM-barrel enzyme
VAIPMRELFGQSQPIIAMAHLPACRAHRGTMRREGWMPIVKWVRQDVEILIKSGIDGILSCNEDGRPYAFQVGYEAAAASDARRC